MDPVANLQRQREIVHELTVGEVIDRLDDPYAQELVSELGELVEALDEWRSKGGFGSYQSNLAHEIADAIVNEHGYASDGDESELRAKERDRLEVIIARTLEIERR